jgi:hypothetical protein
MPQRVVLHRPPVDDSQLQMWSVTPIAPGIPGFGYTLGVGVDWRVAGARRSGFVTVAHPFWQRGASQSLDVVQFADVAPQRYFWLRSVQILHPSAGVDASLHELELLTDPSAPVVSPLFFPPGSAVERTAVEAAYCPNAALPVVVAGELPQMEAAQVELFFEPAGGGPWCRFTKAMPTIPPVDPLDPSVSMGPLTGLRDAIRAARITTSLVRFDRRFSGQGWTVGGRLLAIQVGVADPHSVLPAKYGYALAAHAAVGALDTALLTHPGYDAGSLRIVSVF